MAENSYAYNFDRYLYDGNDYSAFEPRSNTVRKVNTAGKKKVKPAPAQQKKQSVEKQKAVKKTVKLHKVEDTKENKSLWEEIAGNPTAKEITQTKMSAMRVAVLVCTGAVLFGLIGVNIGMRAVIDTVSRENIEIMRKTEIAKSENIRLNTEIDAMFSPDKVDNYAVNVLGMVKLEDYKVRYFDFKSEDKVIISGNKEYK